MRERYIKALLIVLAATGVEAQLISYAQKTNVGEFAVAENLSPSEFRTLRADILSVVNALKNLNNHSGDNETYHPYGFGLASKILLSDCRRGVSALNIYFYQPRFSLAAAGGSIKIRAPSHS